MTLKIFPTLPHPPKTTWRVHLPYKLLMKNIVTLEKFWIDPPPPERHVIYGRSLRHLENVRLNFGVDFGNECIILWFWFVEFIKSVHISEFSSKDMIQIFVFWNYFLLRIKTLESPNQKTKLDRMFIFFLGFFFIFFILADKISKFTKFWLPIQNLNRVAVL